MSRQVSSTSAQQAPLDQGRHAGIGPKSEDTSMLEIIIIVGTQTHSGKVSAVTQRMAAMNFAMCQNVEQILSQIQYGNEYGQLSWVVNFMVSFIFSVYALFWAFAYANRRKLVRGVRCRPQKAHFLAQNGPKCVPPKLENDILIFYICL